MEDKKLGIEILIDIICSFIEKYHLRILFVIAIGCVIYGILTEHDEINVSKSYKFTPSNVWVKIEDNSSIKVIKAVQKVKVEGIATYYDVLFADSQYDNIVAESQTTLSEEEYKKILGQGQTGLLNKDYTVTIISYYKGIGLEEAKKTGQMLYSRKVFKGIAGTQSDVNLEDISNYIDDVISKMNKPINAKDIDLVLDDGFKRSFIDHSDVELERSIKIIFVMWFAPKNLYTDKDIENQLQGYIKVSDYKKNPVKYFVSIPETGVLNYVDSSGEPIDMKKVRGN